MGKGISLHYQGGEGKERRGVLRKKKVYSPRKAQGRKNVREKMGSGSE